jgi:hypothetical protein
VRPRQRRRRVALAGLLLLLPLLAISVFLASALTHPAHAQPNQAGADDTRMQAAVTAAQWPQQNGIWCGVADIAAIASYQGTPTTQNSVANFLNSDGGRSEWGTPSHDGRVAWGPGFPADISRDGGTDPRSMAAGLTELSNGSYHQLVDYHSAYNATAHLVADLVRTQEPITVFVNAASHSVLVSAVQYYGSDPTNLNNVTRLEVWDSGVGLPGTGIQANQRQWVSLNEWLYGYVYYGATYHANYVGGLALDPDPSVGPYTYDPSQGRNTHLWIGHYVYIHPDAPGEAARGVNPDWAVNQDGALIRGLNGELPNGYAGPSVPMYIPPPPPPPPTPTPTATPRPTFTPHPPRATDPEVDVTPANTAVPTPGSSYGFSLQSVCLGSPCSGAEALSTIALGGASSLGATLLVVVGVITVRRRKRRSAVATGQSQPSSDAVAETGEAPGASAEGALDSGAASATLAAGEVAHGTGVAEQAMDAAVHESVAGADAGPLARLASTSQRLERLAQTGAPAVKTTDATTPSEVDEPGRAVGGNVPPASADVAAVAPATQDFEARGELAPGATDAPSTESANEAGDVVAPEAEHDDRPGESGGS